MNPRIIPTAEQLLQNHKDQINNPAPGMDGMLPSYTLNAVELYDDARERLKEKSKISKNIIPAVGIMIAMNPHHEIGDMIEVYRADLLHSLGEPVGIALAPYEFLKEEFAPRIFEVIQSIQMDTLFHYGPPVIAKTRAVIAAMMQFGKNHTAAEYNKDAQKEKPSLGDWVKLHALSQSIQYIPEEDRFEIYFTQLRGQFSRVLALGVDFNHLIQSLPYNESLGNELYTAGINKLRDDINEIYAVANAIRHDYAIIGEDLELPHALEHYYTYPFDSRYGETAFVEALLATPGMNAYDSEIKYRPLEGDVIQDTRIDPRTPIIFETPWEGADFHEICNTSENQLEIKQRAAHLDTGSWPGLSYYHTDFNSLADEGALNGLAEAPVSVDSYSGGTLRSVANKARISYGRTSRAGEYDADQENKDRRLIRRLVNDNHGSVFEHNQIVFRLVVPNFAMKQMLRHRIGVSFNEESARYTELIEKFYMPTRMKLQSDKNHQGGTDEYLEEKQMYELWSKTINAARAALDVYKFARNMNVAREQARVIAPFGMHTRCFMTFNLRSFFHFLNLRLSEHAQYETREYAKMMTLAAIRVFPDVMRVVSKIEKDSFLNKYAVNWIKMQLALCDKTGYTSRNEEYIKAKDNDQFGMSEEYYNDALQELRGR